MKLNTKTFDCIRAAVRFEYILLSTEAGIIFRDVMFGMTEPLESVLKTIKANGSYTYDDMTSDLATYDFNK